MSQPDTRPSDPYPYDRMSRDALARLITDALQRAPTPVEPLQEEVCAFVRMQKGTGAPPERVLADLKAIIDRASPFVRTQDQAALVERVVRWCIDEFYRPPLGAEDGAPAD